VTIFALLLVSLAACGGGENTFEREGVSFTYPEDWGEAEYEAVDPAALFGTAFTRRRTTSRVSSSRSPVATSP